MYSHKHAPIPLPQVSVQFLGVVECVGLCSKRKCKTKLSNQVLALSTFLGCKLLRLSPFSLFCCMLCFKQLRAMSARHRNWAGLAVDLLHEHDLELLQLGYESMKPPTLPPPCNPRHPFDLRTLLSRLYIESTANFEA